MAKVTQAAGERPPFRSPAVAISRYLPGWSVLLWTRPLNLKVFCPAFSTSRKLPLRSRYRVQVEGDSRDPPPTRQAGQSEVHAASHAVSLDGITLQNVCQLHGIVAFQRDVRIRSAYGLWNASAAVGYDRYPVHDASKWPDARDLELPGGCISPLRALRAQLVHEARDRPGGRGNRARHRSQRRSLFGGTGAAVSRPTARAVRADT